MSQKATEIYNQGYRYYTGTKGYPLNYNKAFECFKESAELGESQAMNYLGVIYEKGEIVTQNYRLAVDWYYRAIKANNGNAIAAYNLGRMYYAGTGVEKDMEKAYDFFDASVNLGLGNKHSAYPKSCYYVGCILMEYYKNKKEAYLYFSEAAKYGNIPEAWHNLGWLCEINEVPSSVTANKSQESRDGAARGFYEKAANLGFAQSMDALGRICAKYNMLDEAKTWLRKASSLGYEPAQERLRLLTGGVTLKDIFKYWFK